MALCYQEQKNSSTCTLKCPLIMFALIGDILIMNLTKIYHWHLLPKSNTCPILIDM
jgi:hypothetical protein